MQLWKIRESEIDSHILRHCFITEPELDRESVVMKDFSEYELPIRWFPEHSYLDFSEFFFALGITLYSYNFKFVRLVHVT